MEFNGIRRGNQEISHRLDLNHESKDPECLEQQVRKFRRTLLEALAWWMTPLPYATAQSTTGGKSFNTGRSRS